jgi:asparagine synthase (glutamine-hydrolysing)
MCGIFGIYNITASEPFREVVFKDSLLTMQHRGPDANSVKSFNNKAILGHVRLSIIDLNEESNQPFVLDDRYWMVYNGEIYNYIELKEALVGAGYHFRTSGDTEVLLRAYQHWGEECVSRFNGMWSFAIYDCIENTLFCSRDRFGIKPFNYALIDDQFIFASEIKAILAYFPQLKNPNYNVIANYCRTGVGAQHRETWFENVFRLEPAHNLLISGSGIVKKRYWDYPRHISQDINFPDAVLKYREILADAVKLRMRSDVPIGFTLSSGLDSTSLVCLLKDQFNGNNHTYTAAFSGNNFDKSEKQNFKNDIEINEPSIVKRLAAELELDPTIIEINYNNYPDELEKIIYSLESGHSSPAIFPLNQILEVARKDVTVIIEGQGADELMGGYISNVMPVYLIELISRLKFKRAYHELKAFTKVYSPLTSFMLFVRQYGSSHLRKMYFQLSGIESFFKGYLKKYVEIKDFPNVPVGFRNILNKHLYKAHTGGLVNLLHYGDAISMAHTLESRLPYMDYRLVEFAFTLPSEYKVRLGLGKYIHRKAMENIVPEYILQNPIKFGFESPLSHIFKEEGENSVKELLLSERCMSRGLFSKDQLNKAFQEHKSGRKNHSRILYRILSVELWFRLFIDH